MEPRPNRSAIRPILMLILVLVFAGTTATADMVEDGSSASKRIIEEIVVTAQKRTQNPQEIGLSLTVFSGDRLHELGVDNLEGAFDHLPGTGFYDTTGGGVPVMVVRGVGLQNFRINDTPTTAVYVDDVYQTSVAQAAATIFDLERVEVLKGPQGGLYGRNAVGGAIQVLSREPRFDSSDGFLSLGYGRYGRLTGEAAFGGPLSDSVAGRIAARYVSSDDTQFKSVPGGFRHGAEDRWAVRGQLAFRPNNTIDVLAKLESGKDTSETPLLRAVGVWAPLGLDLAPGANIADGVLLNAAGIDPGLDAVCPAIVAGGRNPGLCETIDGSTPVQLGIDGRHDSASVFRPQLDNSWTNASVRARVDWGDYIFTSISAYNEFNHDREVDLDAVPTRQQHIDYESTIEFWSQEFRLAYEGGSDVTWLVGVNYAEDKLEESTLLSADAGLFPFAFGLTAADQPYTQRTKSAAGYGHAEWHFAHDLNLVIDGRYTWENKDMVGGTFLPDFGVFLAFIDDNEDYAAFTGKLGLEWTPVENALYYAGIARGFKSGGFFGGFAATDAQLEAFDEETIVAYEAGFKRDWLDHRVRLNGSAYFYDRKDVQASGFDPTGTLGVQRLTNIGDVEVIGSELNATWAPLERLGIEVGIAYLDAEVVDSNNVVSDLFFATSTAPLEGTRPPNQPEFTANVVARYEQPLARGLLGTLQVEYIYRSDQDLKRIVTPEEKSIAKENGYALVNVRTVLHSGDGNWKVSAFVNNLFDEGYRTVVVKDDLGGVYELYGEPRLWGVTFWYDF